MLAGVCGDNMDNTQLGLLTEDQQHNPSSHNKQRNDKFCRVCGAKAISFNYNGLACESCKTFFRRNSFKPDTNFRCYNGNRCEINQFNRKSCKRCRMDRCFAIGMKKELIWKSKYPPEVIDFPEDSQKQSRDPSLSQREQEHLNEVLCAVGNIPEERSLECLGVVANGREFVAYPPLYINKFIKYCKGLSSFQLLDSEDQLALVKTSYVQTLNIRFAFSYDLQTNQFASIANIEGTKSILMDNSYLFEKKHRDPSTPVRLIKFQQTLNALMENDRSIRNLIMVQFLFSNTSESLHNLEFVRHQYYFYSTLLLRYLEHKHQSRQVAKQKYFTLMRALSAMDYQFEKIREMFQSSSGLAKQDPVHKEIFGL